MILAQECDEIAYRAAFACQKQAYIVTTTKGSHDFKSKYTKTEIINHFKKKGKQLDIDYKLENYLLIEPEHIVNYTLDRMIAKLYLVEHKAFGKVTGVQLWLSPSDGSNFRHKIATLMGPNGLGYKAGRGTKPHYLKYIRERLISNYGAKEAFGYEADDALGMAAGEGVILSHIDKDMNMIEGWHYNHVTEQLYFIEEGLGTIDFIDGKTVGRGLLFFYLQLLTGDAVDNIPGCINEAKSHHKTPPKHSGASGCELLAGVETEAEAFSIVAEAYQYTYKDNWLDALMECADLLWMVREPEVTGRKYLQSKRFI